jgi:serine/threonine protein kinase
MMVKMISICIARDLVKKMLEVDPEKRLSSNEALNHQWFQMTIKNKIQFDVPDEIK